MMPRTLTALAAILLLLASCGEEALTGPKPRAYPRVEFPERRTVAFTEGSCPLTFDHPDYMEVRRDSTFFAGAAPHPCWFDLHIPAFNADLHFTYSEIQGKGQFQQLVQDAFRLANEQNKRANYIEEFQIRLPERVSGMAFNFEGPSASPFQFFLTDSTEHFLRGSLYFNTRPNPDSLAPAAEFVKADIMRIIESLRWK